MTIVPPDARLSPEEQRELLATAAVFESVLEAGGLDAPTLESLREIYERLGDRPRLVETLERLAALTAPAVAPAVSTPPAWATEPAVYVPPPGAFADPPAPRPAGGRAALRRR